MRMVVPPLVAVLAVARLAAAEPDPVEAAAQVHLDRGIAAYQAGDFPRARAELTTARELVPHKPNPYRWLALTEVQLGDCPRAQVDIDAFMARSADDDPRRAELVRLRELCARRAAVVSSVPPPRRSTARPITRRWWFWSAVGVVAVGAVGAAAYAAGDAPPATLPGVTCDGSGCRLTGR
ncbi:MAG: hypothetical protein R3B06_01485 [Kofleriaceae bacterium]